MFAQSNAIAAPSSRTKPPDTGKFKGARRALRNRQLQRFQHGVEVPCAVVTRAVDEEGWCARHAIALTFGKILLHPRARLVAFDIAIESRHVETEVSHEISDLPFGNRWFLFVEPIVHLPEPEDCGRVAAHAEKPPSLTVHPRRTADVVRRQEMSPPDRVVGMRGLCVRGPELPGRSSNVCGGEQLATNAAAVEVPRSFDLALRRRSSDYVFDPDG